jgi:secreted PhoX family phosphatase
MSQSEDFQAVARRFLSRRDILRGAAAASALAAMPLGALTTARASTALPALAFTELGRMTKTEPTHHVAPGYTAKPLIAWGDPLFADASAFDPMNQTAAAQLRQFGTNCDYIGYLPLSDGASSKSQHLASADSTHGLLCVNHEYTRARQMFTAAVAETPTAESVAVERAAVGHSVIEIRRGADGWSVVPNSSYARRLHADTLFDITGPARGHDRMKTAMDPDGTTAKGTFHNCGGGVTPWGTILSGEENVQDNFRIKPAQLDEKYARDRASAESFAVGAKARWANFDERFDMNLHPYEFNHFGWVLEIDPYEPSARPKKRTALGRFRHEGATIFAQPGKPVVAYMGDDQSRQYIYKFVSSAPYDAVSPGANADILDSGTLYAARFKEDGSGEWLALVHGQWPLTTENGFEDQGDVLIDTRRAARLLGATPTDRPEDIETDPLTQRVYAACTAGTDRKDVEPGSPRAPNLRGHIIEIIHPGTDGNRDHRATEFTWDILLLAGHPRAEASSKGLYGPGTSDAGYFAMPDNLVFDPAGRLWIATDGADGIGLADGLWACAVTGPERAVTRHFFSCPRGAEMCGPCFTPDGTTLFVAVQHPGDDEGSSFDAPSTRWPADMDSAMPPRPAVVAITRDGGGPIGG